MKLECEVCHKLGMCKVFLNKWGKIRYGRVRHYEKTVIGRPIFSYHPQTLEYLNRKLGDITNNIDLIGHNDKPNDDLKLLANSSVIQKEVMMVGLPGFEPGSIEPKSTSLDQASRQPR